MERLKDNNRNPTRFWWVSSEEGPSLGLLLVPGHHLLILGKEPRAAAFAAQAWGLEPRFVPGLVAPEIAALPFSRIWIERHRLHLIHQMRQGFFEIQGSPLELERKPEGCLRYARVSDLPLMNIWLGEFLKETLPHELERLESLKDELRFKVNAGIAFLWVVEGQPVSMACLSKPTLGGLTVNTVYSPRDRRRSGFASALVHGVSRLALGRGFRSCSLYVNLDDQSATHLYERVGYRLRSEVISMAWSTLAPNPES